MGPYLSLAAAVLLSTASAQDTDSSRPQGFAGTAAGKAPRVEIPWNRLYDTDELYAHFDRLVAARPDLMQLEAARGKSIQGRELRVYVVSGAKGDPHAKPAMWVDANVHGNEVQGGEAVLYLAWYLLENADTNPRVQELLANSTFYLMPTVNPDGRSFWFQNANTASSSRTGQAPIDSDRDGLFDEDPPNDLDGDGHITRMRKYVPGEGDYDLDPNDPRRMVRVTPMDQDLRGDPADRSDRRGDWILLGSEGIDDDGDGRINEDGEGGYDMNRAWPSSWQPPHVQRGAGPIPLYWPETSFIADYILGKPNIAAVQSFHNAGGMILRGPGAEGYGSYPRADRAVYDSIGEDGEHMLPFYRYWVIWDDLYTVFGGFVNWTYEGLGIISFTNELWRANRTYPDPENPPSEVDPHFFDDRMLLGDGFVPWKPYQHPLYGEVEIGGFKKDVGRVPPSFLIEEETHRNALFCIRHAAAMPKVSVASTTVSPLPGGLLSLEVLLRNEHAIPTRTALAASKGLGRPDIVTLEGAEVLAGGQALDPFRPERIDLVERDPGRLVLEQGIGGHSDLRLRWILRPEAGTEAVTLRWTSEKSVDLELPISLRPAPPADKETDS